MEVSQSTAPYCKDRLLYLHNKALLFGEFVASKPCCGGEDTFPSWHVSSHWDPKAATLSLLPANYWSSFAPRFWEHSYPPLLWEMTNHLPGSSSENFDCGNLRIEWRLTKAWGDDSPLCLCGFFSGWGSALSYLAASFLRGSSPLLSTLLHLHGNQSFCRSGIKIVEGEKNPTDAGNTRQQRTQSWEGQHAHSSLLLKRWTDGWTRWHKSEVFVRNSWSGSSVRLLSVCGPWKRGLILASQNPAAWHWPPLFF